MSIIMKCGHAANATDSNGNRVCAICSGLTEGYATPEEVNLENREARCPYCKKTKKSDVSLAFFFYTPEKEFDSYYCGCLGWN